MNEERAPRENKTWAVACVCFQSAPPTHPLPPPPNPNALPTRPLSLSHQVDRGHRAEAGQGEAGGRGGRANEAGAQDCVCVFFSAGVCL